MANKISAKQVLELRQKTGIGMMDAKKALVAADGDMDKAVDVLREKGVAKAAKKSGRVAAEGLADIAVYDNAAAIVEVNAETDYVASNDKFQNFVKDVTEVIAKNKPADMDAAMKLNMGDDGDVEQTITALTAVIGEKISLRRFKVVEKSDDEVFGKYIHNGGQIAALVVDKGGDEATAKDIAMHVAAINPQFLNRVEVPDSEVKHQTEVFTEETKNEGKPEKILPKIVDGRMNKWYSEVCLVDQKFIKDPDMTVAKYAESKGAEVQSYVRYEVGEGIEKAQDDFAAEIKKQIDDAKN
ncbi:Translation elongation factor Ts [Lactobacillus selangorensis]|uniref:Elongation factor Ts n=1 Tax=Lactobacillus selangorensis TaxID=81857 RepID=A0A0R2FN81_9LACO|nr:translation elongation factor Ts [Lactobacillus selangorensis]KRN29614.1 Translation elongation factor Ts [Lactobacillus selangorensis]KRN33856.1 Translation elongation factor Ts [Lactobacillus selangorensis]